MRCVLVLPDEQTPPPGSLVAGLERRGLAVDPAAGPEQAMVALGRSPAAALVVVEPIRVRGLEHLVDAVASYHPGVVCWRYDQRDGASDGSLASFNADGPAEAGLHATPAARSLVHRVDRPEEDDTSPLITEEELAMLLGESPPPKGPESWGKNPDSSAPGS